MAIAVQLSQIKAYPSRLFKFPATRMTVDFILKDWMPKQPDCHLLKGLLALVSYDFQEFIVLVQNNRPRGGGQPTAMPVGKAAA